MWNVYQFCKDYLAKKIPSDEFLKIYDCQFQLKRFLNLTFIENNLPLTLSFKAEDKIKSFRESNDLDGLYDFIKDIIFKFDERYKSKR